jgi:hypothetical protein
MDTKTVKVQVMLSEDYRLTCMGFDPTLEAHGGVSPLFDNGAWFTLELDEYAHVLDIAELAFAICNSSPAFEYRGNRYPAELHCKPEYEGIVEAYRATGHRSLSVGDVVVIHEPREQVSRYSSRYASTWLAVDRCGFKAI